MTERLNSDYEGERAAFEKDVVNIARLDSKGCEMIAAIARALSEYWRWSPLDPASDDDLDRAAGDQQIGAFQELVRDMLGGEGFADRILPLAEARQKFQAEIEDDEAYWRRRGKRRQRSLSGPVSGAKVLQLVPPNPLKDDEGDPSSD